jgi:Leucine-rich repeat (LRR) protein
MIEETNGLESLSNLSTVDLSFNRITTLTGLEPLTVLSDLNLSANNIAHADNVLLLQGLKFLTALNLDVNPVQEIMDYRLALIFRLQRLTVLDTEEIESEEKVVRCSFLDRMLHLMMLLDPTPARLKRSCV